MATDRPRKPSRVWGRGPAFFLAIGVNLLFIAVLVFSLRWQNRQAEPVSAELYAPPKAAPAVEPAAPPPVAPPIEAPVAPPPSKPEPAREPTPPPPPKIVAPKLEANVEKPDTRAADIARKAREEDERKKREEAARKDREKKAADQREADKKKLDEARRLAESRDRQQREAEALKAQAEREQAAQQKNDADAAARTRAEADYIRRLQSKVKGNLVLPSEMPGNPEAIFEVVQLPTGEIIDAVLRKSSGVRAYDDAVQRAILKSSPLPRPERADLFQRTLTLKFRPQD